MTEEELKAQVDALTKERDALARKTEELLGETKAERERRRAAETAQQEAREEAERQAREAAEKAGDVEALRAQWEAKASRDVAAEREARVAAEGRLNRLVIDAGIRDAMTAANVAPALLRGAMLAFRDGRKIEIRDDAPLVDGVPLAQAVTDWAATEEGASYKAATKSNGSGAPGGGNGGGRGLADMTEAERLELARTDPGRLRAMRGRS